MKVVVVTVTTSDAGPGLVSLGGCSQGQHAACTARINTLRKGREKSKGVELRRDPTKACIHAQRNLDSGRSFGTVLNLNKELNCPRSSQTSQAAPRRKAWPWAICFSSAFLEQSQ